MTKAESDIIVKEVQIVSGHISKYSESAQLDSFLTFYDNSPTFIAISSDGKMRDYDEFKQISSEYYTALKEQKIETIQEKIHVIDPNLVVLGSTININAQFKNGDRMIMNNYSITCVFEKIGNDWKVIHSHESALPPEIIRKK